MRPLWYDFGNGEADTRVVQLDSDFPIYRENKLACYSERRSKYWQCESLDPSVCLGAVRALASRLSLEYPSLFEASDSSLSSSLSGDRVVWREDGSLDVSQSILPVGIEHPLEAMAFQIQADLALVVRAKDGLDRNAAIHLCAPSHWAAEAKIGRSFFATHQSIPGFDPINAVAPRLVRTMIQQGPFVRFVWGVESDDRLNHHPSPPPSCDPVEWNGRLFGGGRFWVRTERQSLLGIPEIDAALFFIHVRTVPDTLVLARPDLRDALLKGLLSMSPEAREYKGIASGFQELIGLLG